MSFLSLKFAPSNETLTLILFVVPKLDFEFGLKG